MMKVIVSACLMGDNCKYNGKNNYSREVVEYLKDKDYIKVCPECMGGLKVPRIPCEIIGKKVINKNKEDMTKEFSLGAKKTLDIAKKNNIKVAILKSRSPSCGSEYVYDGTFKSILVKGEGITTRLLRENGFEIISSDTIINEYKEKIKV